MPSLLPIVRISAALSPFALAGILSDSFKLAYFARPAAWLAAFFCGSRAPERMDDGYAFSCFGLDVLINSSCTGVNFFAICLCAVFFVLSRRSKSHKTLLLNFAFAAAIAYPFTIFANACRIFSASLSWKILSGLLDDRYFNLVHMGVGLLNFFMLLAILICVLNFKPHARPYIQ